MITDLETIKISQLPQASASTPADRFPIEQDGETLSIEPGLLSSDWRPLGVTPLLISSDGQRFQSIRYPDVNYSGVITNGGKIRIPRTGTTPTASMAFVAASLQYASKVAPTGITFTDDFTCEAWVYLDSYSATAQSIITRADGTGASGLNFNILPDGRVELAGLNSPGGRYINSYQSIPLHKWTHIAGTLDMSGWTAATNKIFIDGADVQVSLNQFGTNPTSLVQTGDLQIGRLGTTKYISAKIANVRLWSAVRTAAQIRDNMNKETPDSTVGLVGHWKGNGSWNDSSANLNHLTPAGGAMNNFVLHPYSSIEYATITKVQFTGAHTEVTLFTGNGCLPNELLGSSSYSTAYAPYGLPTDLRSDTLRLAKIDIMAPIPVGTPTGDIVKGMSRTLTTKDGILKVTFNITQFYNTVDAIRGDFYITVDGVSRAIWYERTWTSGNGGNTHCLVADIPVTAGVHTIDCRIGIASGAGTLYGATTAPSYMLVEQTA